MNIWRPVYQIIFQKFYANSHLAQKNLRGSIYCHFSSHSGQTNSLYPHKRWGIYVEVTLLGKGVLRLLIGWSWIIWMGPIIITRVFKSGRGRQKREPERHLRENDPAPSCWIWRRRKGPWAKECGRCLEAGKGKEWDSPLELLEEFCQQLDLSPVWDFWLQNCSRIHLGCFRPLNLQSFVATAIENCIGYPHFVSFWWHVMAVLTCISLIWGREHIFGSVYPEKTLLGSALTPPSKHVVQCWVGFLSQAKSFRAFLCN